MEKVLSIFSRLWSGDNRAHGMRRQDIETWAKTEYSKDWKFAYNYYIAAGKMPREQSTKGFKKW